MTTPAVRWAIAVFCPYSEVWFARPARPPSAEDRGIAAAERHRHDPEEEARELPLGYRPLSAPPGGRAPSRRQRAAIKKALGLARRRNVEFSARFDAGNPHTQEGWDIRWQATK
jgi:hypothetical protein